MLNMFRYAQYVYIYIYLLEKIQKSKINSLTWYEIIEKIKKCIQQKQLCYIGPLLIFYWSNIGDVLSLYSSFFGSTCIQY